MRLQIFVVLGLFSFYGWSQTHHANQWSPIIPLTYCPQFQIEFTQTHDGEYLVRIPTPSGPRNIDQPLQNINDLSSLTDILVEESVKICSGGRSLLRIEHNAVYFEEEIDFETVACHKPLDYSPPYLDLIREVVGILQHNGNRCDQLMAYTELQTKIEQLSSEELVQLERPGNLFHRAIQIFTGKDTDKMIDLYNTCGGKNFSDKFIANLILLEAKNSCIIPKPPGMMNFEDAKNLALDVARPYDNLGLVKLNSKKDEITKKAILALTQKTMENEVGDLMGPHVSNVSGFVNSLASVQELKAKNLGADDMDYISHGFTIDATFEVAQKALPILAAGSFKEKLPVNWTDLEKDRYLSSTLVPATEQAYASCMAGHYEKMGYGLNLREEEKLAKRLRLKENYCSSFPEQCEGNSCSEKVNLVSNSPGISDAQVVQGCVMSSMLLAINPILKEGIKAQKETFQNDFDLNEEMVDTFTQKTWESLLYCANRQVLEVNEEEKEEKINQYSDPNNPPILSNPVYLQNLSPAAFENILTDCAEVAEAGVAREFYATTLLNLPALAEVFSGGDRVSIAGSAYPGELSHLVEEVISSAYDPCLYKQHYIIHADDPGQTLPRKNAMLCAPMVEIAASTAVIRKTIGELFEESGLSTNSSALLTLKEFENCAEASQENALSALGRAPGDHPSPIQTDQDANNYLAKNNEFFGCVKTAILQTTSIVGGAQFDKAVADLGGAVTNTDYLISLKGSALNVASKCFESSLNEIENWRQFSEFNQRDGLKELEEVCAARALDHVLPKALLSETRGQMAPLIEENIVHNQGQVNAALAATALQLRQIHNLQAPEDLEGDALLEWTFANAHNAHVALEGKDMDSFIEEYTALTMNNAIELIHDNIRNRVARLQAPDDFSDFIQVLTPSCMYQIYSKFEPEIAQLLEKMEQMPEKPEDEDKGPMLDVISQVIVDGLRYQKSLGARAYQEKVNAVENVCKNAQDFQTPLQLGQSQAFDFILKSQTQQALLDTFNEVVTDQCKQELTTAAPRPEFTQLIETACAARSSLDVTNAFSEIMTHPLVMRYPASQRILSFAQNRHLDMINLLNEKLNNPQYVEEAIFSGNPSPVLEMMYENFSNIMTEDEDTMKELSSVVAGKLFLDRSRGSFADKFARIQVTNGLGVAGFNQAYAQINPDAIQEQLGWRDWVVDKRKVIRYSREALSEKWTPKGIEELMAWDQMSDAQRESLINAIYTQAVVRTVNGDEMDEGALQDAIGSHATEYNYPGGVGSFSERLIEHISNYVKERKFKVLGRG